MKSTSRASRCTALVLAVGVATSCVFWPGDLYVVSFRSPATFADALSFAREKEIDATHILFHHNMSLAGRGGIRLPKGSDTDPSEMDAQMASLRAGLIRDLELSEQQLEDIKIAIHCATGLQAHVDGGRELSSVRGDPRVAAVSRLTAFSVVASGELSPEDFEDCVNAILNVRSGPSTVIR